jgi:hypothetical protein
MDVLIGSSWPPPNASNESAKAVSPLNSSPRAALLKNKNKKTRNQPLPNAMFSTLISKSVANKHKDFSSFFFISTNKHEYFKQ